MNKIAIQGIAGSFHHEAVNKYFGEAELVERKSFLRMTEAVKHKEADFGMMALENSIAGPIIPNYTLIIRYGMHIIGEVYLPIRLNLLALDNVKLKDIETVQSHRMALYESDIYLNKHQNWEIIERYDTASATKEILDKQLQTTASVASPFAGELYKMHTLAEDIQNTNYNYTRFVVISKDAKQTSTFNKVSMMLIHKHEPGSLVSVLKRMAALNMNLTKLQSVPIPEKPFEYMFFIDVLLPNDKQSYYDLIELLKRATSEFKILGEYQSGNFAGLFEETKDLFDK